MSCPLCGKEYGLIFNRASDVYWQVQGGGQAVCKKCVKTRMSEIEEHNAPYKANGNQKDVNCKHEWTHPNPTMWFCVKCKAVFRWTCGCGGSEYVCEKHQEKMEKSMIKKEGSVEAYLAKHSW